MDGKQKKCVLCKRELGTEHDPCCDRIPRGSAFAFVHETDCSRRDVTMGYVRTFAFTLWLMTLVTAMFYMLARALNA